GAVELSRPGFDAAVWEVWPSLASGATVHIAEDERRLDPAGLRNWLVEQRITVGFVPTPVAERLLALEWPKETALRVLLTGADTLHRHPPAGLPFTLVNNYGPTEAAVVTTSGAIASADAGESRPTIGKPIDNVDVHIVDEHLRPVATGIVGALCVGRAGARRLVAYVVPAPDMVPLPSMLRERLKTTLPEYMIPAVFVRLDTLPLTANGKVDRDALPAPDTADVLRDEPVTAPRTPVEQRLALIVASLLDTSAVGVNDNFFLLGGHSLLGTQLIARVRD